MIILKQKTIELAKEALSQMTSNSSSEAEVIEAIEALNNLRNMNSYEEILTNFYVFCQAKADKVDHLSNRSLAGILLAKNFLKGLR